MYRSPNVLGVLGLLISLHILPAVDK
jgi:hypothetical protein